MPELPEVEVTRRGLLPALLNRIVTAIVVRHAGLRYPVPQELESVVRGREVIDVSRRGKYLLLDFGDGTVILHLGMSGSLRLLPAATPPQTHDHVDLVFGDTALRLRDPRRFGAILWHPGDINAHPLISPLGVEPLSADLTPQWLFQATRKRTAPIKQVLMDSHTLVGVGNIYASESLFRARIHPRTPARRLSLQRCARLVPAIRETLQAALAAGGSSLRDFTHSDGGKGYFQQQYFVYDRAGEPCRVCDTPIRALRQGQRSTFYCPHCQH